MTIKLPNRISYEIIQQKLNQFQTQRNKVSSSINSLEHRERKEASTNRNKRTRTLIQLGGLLKISGLMDICDIQEGDDLQINLEDTDKAATLLGILMTCVENMRNDLEEAHMTAFKEKGIKALKMSPYYTRTNIG